MTSRVTWVDPVNRDAFFLKLIVDVAGRLGSPIDVFTTLRTGAELEGAGRVQPFFKGVGSLPLGPVSTIQRLRMLLGYRGGFAGAADAIPPGAAVLYSSEVFVPRLERGGLGRVRQKAGKLTRLVHNADRTAMLLQDAPSRYLFDDWIFLSEYVRAQAVEMFRLDRGKTFVLLHPHFHPVLETVEADPTLSQEISRWAAGRRLLAFISRPSRAHGIDLFYRTLATARDQGLPLCGIVMGRLDEGWTAELDAAARKEHGLTDNVLRQGVGAYGYPQLLSVLTEADAVVAPYRKTSQSGAIALAVGEGVPVLASAAGANPELVRDDTDGVILDFDAPIEVEACLTSLYSDGGRARDRFGGNRLESHLDPYAAVTSLLNRLAE
jgi:glycosyltransferase involved in cell wall biosynthesis